MKNIYIYATYAITVAFILESKTFALFPYLRSACVSPAHERRQVMKFKTSKYRSSITDHHLSAVFPTETSVIQPDFNALVQDQDRLDFSHLRGEMK